MPTNYTPIMLETPATPDEFNMRFQELDDAIENAKDGTAELAAPQISSFVNSQHDHTDSAGGGLLPFDALDATAAIPGQVLQVDDSNKIVAATLGFIPTGGFIPYGGVSAPLGWLLCDGSAVSRTTYADLFAVVSTSFGVGDGSTTFNLPDLRGRVLAGLDNMGGSNANVVTDVSAESIGGEIGTETHTLTIPEIPAHSHGVGSGGDFWVQKSGGSYFVDNGAGSTAARFSATETIGSGETHQNMQPTTFVNWLIKV